MDALVKFKSEKGKAIAEFLTSKGIPAAALDNVELRYIMLDGGNGDVSKYAKKIEEAVNVLDRNKVSDNARNSIKVITEW